MQRSVKRLSRAAILASLALVVVIVVRTLLWLTSYRKIQSLIPAGSAVAAHPAMSWRVADTVERVARLVPGATCLTKAFSSQAILAMRGYRSEVRIGVAREEDGRFSAHAWLVSDGLIVAGIRPEELAHFQPLTELTTR